MKDLTISLRPITRDNIAEVCRLRVAEDQEEFVSRNVSSIAEAYVEPTFRPLALYAGDDLVGFTMYGQDESTGRWWVIRLMIDRPQQGKGFGRQAMEALIPLMIEREGMDQIFTSYVPGNEGAAHLYRSLGFIDTGEMDEGEHLMRLDVAAWRGSSAVGQAQGA